MPTLVWIHRSKGSTSADSGGSSALSGRSAEAVPDTSTAVFSSASVVPAVSSKQSAEARSDAEILVDFQRLIESRPDGGQERKRKMSPSAKVAMVAEKKCKTTSKRDLPTGVSKTSSGKFRAQIQLGGKTRYIGTFDTPEQASAAYVSVKKDLGDVKLSALGADEVTTLFKAAQKKAVESFGGLVTEERVLPTGVQKTPFGKYQARLQWGDKQRHIGTFDTPEQAFAAYASMRKECGDIDLSALGADEVVTLFNAAQRKAVEIPAVGVVTPH